MTIPSTGEPAKAHPPAGLGLQPPGGVFITVCAKDRQPIFGRVVGTSIARPPEVVLSPLGRLVESCIGEIPHRYSTVQVEAYIVMPNHIHLLLCLSEDDGRAMLVPTVSEVIRQLKGAVTKQAGEPVWQRRFYDHIIRNQEDYDRIWEYIHTNPAKWEQDRYYTEEKTG